MARRHATEAPIGDLPPAEKGEMNPPDSPEAATIAATDRATGEGMPPAVKEESDTSRSSGISAELYDDVKDEMISNLLEKNQATIVQLADFKPPTSRAEAIALLVKAQVAPDSLEEKPEPPVFTGKRRFIVRTPNVFFGAEIAGLQFENGQCETEDAIKAHMSLEFGCTVIDAATGKDAWPKA